MYLISLFTKLLHFLPSELAHNVALGGLKITHKTGLLKLFIKNSQSKE